MKAILTIFLGTFGPPVQIHIAAYSIIQLFMMLSFCEKPEAVITLVFSFLFRNEESIEVFSRKQSLCTQITVQGCKGWRNSGTALGIAHDYMAVHHGD